MEMKDAKEQVTRVTRDAKSTLESTVTKYLLTVDFLGQAWTCSGIACMRHTCDLGTQESEFLTSSMTHQDITEPCYNQPSFDGWVLMSAWFQHVMS